MPNVFLSEFQREYFDINSIYLFNHICRTLDEVSCRQNLLGRQRTPELKWNSFIVSIAKEAAKIVGSLVGSDKGEIEKIQVKSERKQKNEIIDILSWKG